MKFLMQLLITAGIGIYLLSKASAAEMPQAVHPAALAPPAIANGHA
jgi:hypothetical protein